MANAWRRIRDGVRNRLHRSGLIEKSAAAATSLAGMSVLERSDVLRQIAHEEGQARSLVVAAAVQKSASIDPGGTPPSTTEIGVTGLLQYSGYIDEEFLRELRGKKALETWREMSKNDATVGAVLFAIQMLIRQVKWRVDLGGDDEADVAKGKHLSECLDDMAETWADVIAEILSFLPMGFSLHEPVYKRRLGASRNLKTDSKHADGRIGWQKMPGRSQHTIDRWVFSDDTGELEAAVQVALPKNQEVTIPCSRFLLFRASSAKGNPEGESILRPAYIAWHRKKRIEEVEGIGIEREMAGMPMITVPIELFHPSATDGQKKMLAAMQKMVRNVRIDEQMGITLPGEYDEAGNARYKFELVSTGGSQRIDTTKVVDRYDKRIAMTVLADWLLMGQGSVGSYALASSKTTLFATAIGAWLDVIEQIFNRQAIPALFRLNDFPDTEKLPELKHEDVESADLAELADYVAKLVTSGAMHIDPEDEELENFFRDQASMPHRAEGFVPEPPGRPSFMDRPDPAAPEVDAGDAAVEPGGAAVEPATVVPAARDAQSATESGVDESAAVTAKEVMNGAQITAALEIVGRVVENRLSADSAVALFRVGLGIEESTAREIIGNPELLEQPTAPSFFGGGAPEAEDEPEANEEEIAKAASLVAYVVRLCDLAEQLAPTA